jgi:hypothetical protein
VQPTRGVTIKAMSKTKEMISLVRMILYLPYGGNFQG